MQFRRIVIFTSAFLFLTIYGVVNAPIADSGPATIDNLSTTDLPRNDLPKSGNPKIDRMILDAGAKYGIDPKLIHYVIRQESGFKPHARSVKNAQGLMQLIPETAERFGVKNSYDPRQNIEGGVRYLRWLLKEFDGNVELALAGYNAGEGAVRKYGNKVPRYKETRMYVKNITSAYGRKYHPLPAPEQVRVRFGLAGAIAK